MLVEKKTNVEKSSHFKRNGTSSSKRYILKGYNILLMHEKREKKRRARENPEKNMKNRRQSE